MILENMKKLLLCMVLTLPLPLSAIVGSVVSGQSLWWMVKRIGQTSDIIESKLDALKACEETVLTSADISGGIIAISTPGTYRLGEDVTAGISIQAPCVLLDLNNRIVTGTILMGLPVDNITITDGVVLGDVRVTDFVSRFTIQGVTIGFSDPGSTSPLFLTGSNLQIINCTIKSADGAANPNGDDSGHGIELVGTFTTVIRDCIIYSGAGGNGTGPTNADGGDAGNGIHVNDATDLEIDGCTIMTTGAGGDGLGTGTPGDGGNGIRVLSNCTDVAVHDCIIRNTGAAGTGGSGGSPVAGKAIFDSVTTSGSLSVFLRNFAHNIANTLKYNFQGDVGAEKGTLVANPPDNTFLLDRNQFVNAYMS